MLHLGHGCELGQTILSCNKQPPHLSSLTQQKFFSHLHTVTGRWTIGFAPHLHSGTYETT